MIETPLTLLFDRTLNADLLAWAICPTQDIIACCFPDQISCHRLQWQKLWAYQHSDRTLVPTALAWHPEAKSLAVGFSNGSLVLLDPEAGTLQHVAKPGTGRITSLSWLEEVELERQNGSANWPNEIKLGSESFSAGRHDGFKLPKLTLLLAGDDCGNLLLLTPALSALAHCDIGKLAGTASRPVAIVQAAASRDLRFMYVIWDATEHSPQSGGTFLSVIDITAIARFRTELRAIPSILEIAMALTTESQSLVGQAEEKWGTMLNAVRSMRSSLHSLVSEYSAGTCPENADVDQLERLFVVGESCCIQDLMPHFLTAAQGSGGRGGQMCLGEAGIKKLAKQVDAALDVVVASILPNLQAKAQALLALFYSLHGLLACSPYFDTMSVQEEGLQGQLKGAGELLLLCEMVRLVACGLQAQWRKFFSWMLQTARAMNSDAQLGHEFQTPDSESILRTLTFMRSYHLEPSIFQSLDPSGVACAAVKSLDRSQPGTRQSLGPVLEALSSSCRSSMAALPAMLSSDFTAVQHATLSITPAKKSKLQPSLQLSQSSKDASSRRVHVCCPAVNTSGGIAISILDPPESSAASLHHEVSRMQLGLPASDLLLDSAVVGMGGAVRLVLLVGFKDASGGRLKIVPLLAESSEGLPREQLPLDEAVHSGRILEADAVEGAVTTQVSSNLRDCVPPLAVSGSRQVAAVVTGNRKIFIYDLEEVC